MFPLKSAATAKVLNCWISPSWSVTTKKILTAILKNADGDTLEVEGDECDFKGMAVAIEIAGTGVKHDEK